MRKASQSCLYADACKIAGEDAAADNPTRRVIMSASQQQLRFAIAAFSSSSAAAKAAQDLQTVSRPAGSISYLGSRSALNARTSLLELPFPNNAQPLACTEGEVAQRLARKLDSGALTLQSALATWLIPRHALQLERAVENGEILVWVQLYDSEDEQNAYRILLSAGCTLVGVHDLVKS